MGALEKLDSAYLEMIIMSPAQRWGLTCPTGKCRIRLKLAIAPHREDTLEDHQHFNWAQLFLWQAIKEWLSVPLFTTATAAAVLEGAFNK